MVNLKFQRTKVFFAMIIIFVATTGGYIIYDAKYHEFSGTVAMKDQTIDLYSYDLKGGDRIMLDGTWEFFWNALIVTDGIEYPEPDFLMEVPGSWSKFCKDGKNLGRGGYASYRIKAKNIRENTDVVCYIQNLGCAYKVYINKQLVSDSGVVTKDMKNVIAKATPTLYPIHLEKGKEYEIVVEVATKVGGGINMVPVISEVNKDILFGLTRYIMSFIFAGMLIFCLFCYLVLGFTMRVKGCFRWMPLLFLIIGIRMLITTEQYSIVQIFFEDMSYESMEVPIYICTAAIKFITMMYMRQMLNLSIQVKTIQLFLIYYGFLLVGCLVVRREYWSNDAVLCALFLSMVLELYVVYKTYFEIKNETPFAIWMICGYLFSVVGMNGESLFLLGVLRFSDFFSTAASFLIFALITFGIYGRKIAESYEKDLQLLRMEEQVTQGKVELMLSQIQPHFLYNTLNIIGYFCKTDPIKAEITLIKFSKYLRANMESLGKKKIIMFREELCHIKNYVEMEELRFGDSLEVEYQIENDFFFVPTLTIQPLIENAIKHGITKKLGGGKVILHSFEENDHHCIVITDNGVGFDINQNRGIGLKNISLRLERLVHATLTIESVVGKGTRATIILPKR